MGSQSLSILKTQVHSHVQEGRKSYRDAVINHVSQTPESIPDLTNIEAEARTNSLLQESSESSRSIVDSKNDELPGYFQDEMRFLKKSCHQCTPTQRQDDWIAITFQRFKAQFSIQSIPRVQKNKADIGEDEIKKSWGFPEQPWQIC